jgi:hypothetical protein
MLIVLVDAVKVKQKQKTRPVLSTWYRVHIDVARMVSEDLILIRQHIRYS